MSNKNNDIVFLSDIHFGIRNSSKEWLEIHNDYFENFFIPLIEKRKSKPYLVIAGDLFDNRQSINVFVMHTVMELFKKLALLFKEIHIIAGNHDVFLKSSNDISSLDIIDHISDNIFIYKEPTLIEINKLPFLLLPWENDKIKEVEVIKSQNKFAKYLICHTEIKGFYYNSKVKVKTGNDLSVYKGYKKVFSGHFHLRQESKNLIYLGSPFHFNRADIGDTKGIYIFNTVTETIKLIENNYSPEFKKIKINDILDIPLGELKKDIDNNFIDFYTDDEFISKYNINSLIKELKDVRSIKVNVIELERKINEIVATGDQKFNVIDLCDKYMEDNNYEDHEKGRISSYVENIYNKIAL